MTANDHVTFSRPWRDGFVALSSVVGCSGEMELVTSVSLAVVRGPANLSKAAVALDILSSDGRLILGVGPGSSARDYAAVGIDFEHRWARFDEALGVLRLTCSPAHPSGRFYSSEITLDPRPPRDASLPIWIGSWGSPAGMRRVARVADGWIASAYNLTPAQVVTARATLDDALAMPADRLSCFPARLQRCGPMSQRARHNSTITCSSWKGCSVATTGTLYGQLLVGSAEHCAEVLCSYRAAGIERVFVWPLAEPESQLERVMLDVAPLVDGT